MEIPISVFALHQIAGKLRSAGRELGFNKTLPTPKTGAYTLGGIKLSHRGENKWRAAASDGQRLMILEWKVSDTSWMEDLDGDSVFIPCETCRLVWEARKGKGGKPLKNVVVNCFVSDNVIMIAVAKSGNDVTFTCEPVPGKFPSVDDVLALPVSGAVHEILVNVRYLRDLCDIMIEHGTYAANVPKFIRVAIPEDEKRPIMTQANDGVMIATGVLMRKALR